MKKPFVGTDLKIEKLIEDAAENEATRFSEEFALYARYCESPIERLLLAALFADHRIHEFEMRFLGDFEPSDKSLVGESIRVFQQSKVGPYRCDFLILDASKPLELAEPRWMVVECDGHDFHERTKEQAARDKKRDRFFQSKGYKVLRFTGSEIFADATACAEEVLSQLACDDEWRNRNQ